MALHARRRSPLMAVVLVVLACSIQALPQSSHADSQSAGMYSNYADPGTAHFEADLGNTSVMSLDELVPALLDAIDKLSKYPRPKTLPEIHRVARETIEALACIEQCGVRAIFHPGQGIFIDERNYEVYEYTFIFTVDGKEVEVPYPVIIDKRTREIIPLGRAGFAMLPFPKAQKPPRFSPPQIQTFDLIPGDGTVGDGPPDEERRVTNASLPAALVVRLLLDGGILVAREKKGGGEGEHRQRREQPPRAETETPRVPHGVSIPAARHRTSWPRRRRSAPPRSWPCTAHRPSSSPPGSRRSRRTGRREPLRSSLRRSREARRRGARSSSSR